jgi:hypothetical protein
MMLVKNTTYELLNGAFFELYFNVSQFKPKDKAIALSHALLKLMLNDSNTEQTSISIRNTLCKNDINDEKNICKVLTTWEIVSLAKTAFPDEKIDSKENMSRLGLEIDFVLRNEDV